MALMSDRCALASGSCLFQDCDYLSGVVCADVSIKACCARCLSVSYHVCCFALWDCVLLAVDAWWDCVRTIVIADSELCNKQQGGHAGADWVRLLSTTVYRWSWLGLHACSIHCTCALATDRNHLHRSSRYIHHLQDLLAADFPAPSKPVCFQLQPLCLIARKPMLAVSQAVLDTNTPPLSAGAC